MACCATGPCDNPECHLCTAAGVSHRMLRYVPDVDAEDRDVRMKIGDRVVVRGHWAHGEELQHWYAARDAFLALKAHVWPTLVKVMPRVDGEELALVHSGKDA